MKIQDQHRAKRKEKPSKSQVQSAEKIREQRNTKHSVTDVSPTKELINLEIQPLTEFEGASRMVGAEPKSYYSTVTSGA